MLRILNLSKNSVLATNAAVASSPEQARIGLLSSPGLRQGEGMLFPNCNGVHTIGMRFVIDVIFFNPQSGEIIEAFTMNPGRVWKMTQYPLSMCSVLELPQGTIQLTGTEKGDSIETQEIHSSWPQSA